MARWHSPECRAHTLQGGSWGVGGGRHKVAQGGRRTQGLPPCWAEMLHRMAPGKRWPRAYPVPFKAGRPSEELQVSRELTLGP